MIKFDNLEETYYFVTTHSRHEITYLVRGPLNMTNKQALDIITSVSSDNTPIEVKQRWIGENVAQVQQLEEKQIRELNLLVEDDEDDFQD